MTRTEALAAKARAEAAIKEPWGYDGNHTVAVYEDGEWAQSVVQTPAGLHTTPARGLKPGVRASLQFIAAARADVPDLVDALEEVHSLLDELLADYPQIAENESLNKVMLEWNQPEGRKGHRDDSTPPWTNEHKQALADAADSFKFGRKGGA